VTSGRAFVVISLKSLKRLGIMKRHEALWEIYGSALGSAHISMI
jgi:hypothetical protein